MNKRKKIIRMSALAGVLLVAAVGIILRFSIQPANYLGPLQKAVDVAVSLSAEAQPGNENGQYSLNTIAAFTKQIDAAQQILGAEHSAVSQQKQQLSDLKQATKEFQEAENKNSLPAEELAQLKETDPKLSREVQVTDSTKAVWEIDLTAVEQPEAINFDIRPDSANQEEIDSLLKEESVDGTLLSFRHNGKLPSYAVVSYPYSSDEQGAYLYHYNEDTKALDYTSTVTVVDSQAALSVNEGGDWILVDQKLSGDTASSSSEDAANSESSSSGASSETSSGDAASSSAPAQSPASSGASSGGLRNNAPSGGSGQTGGQTGGTGTTPEGNTPAPPAEQGNTCTIEIRCDTILSNMDKLDPAKLEYVPSNGVILARTQVNFVPGDSVFDVLQAVTYDYGIHMESINKSGFSGAYVNGIAQLYEFDCGDQSGWMYKVNGWFPNYMMPNYKLKNGDAISVVYTCDLGKDVGDQYYN